MPTLAEELTHLGAANRHLRLAVYLVATQEVRLAECQAAGRDSRLHEELLEVMHQTLRNSLSIDRPFAMRLRRSVAPLSLFAAHRLVSLQFDIAHWVSLPDDAELAALLAGVPGLAPKPPLRVTWRTTTCGSKCRFTVPRRETGQRFAGYGPRRLPVRHE
ncbi:hypothetical protein BSFA1_75720 (plasmid) [Burkholderia sp. SFA1]|nr:hypothetical protein BSFA1_75720 [Burkholderia sp. SFA1]